MITIVTNEYLVEYRRLLDLALSRMGENVTPAAYGRLAHMAAIAAAMNTGSYEIA